MVLSANAQDLNSKGDNILGEYFSLKDGSKSKIGITKEADGTYTAQVFWVEKSLDANGNKRKDVKNPDKNLRNIDIDKVVLIKGLKYDADDKECIQQKVEKHKNIGDGNSLERVAKEENTGILKIYNIVANILHSVGNSYTNQVNEDSFCATITLNKKCLMYGVENSIS